MEANILTVPKLPPPMHSVTARGSSTKNVATISAPQYPIKTSLPSLQDAFKKDRTQVLILLDLAIGAMALTKEAVPLDSIKPVFVLLRNVLIMVRDKISTDETLVDICLYSADICHALSGATAGKRDADIPETTLAAITDMNRAIKKMHTKILKASRNSWRSKFLASKVDKETIAGWQTSLDRSVRVFDTQLALFTNIKLESVAEDVSEIKELCKTIVVKPTLLPILLPPPAPKIFFGRDKVLEQVVSFVVQGKHVALIGLGGIGKTSISKKALHDPAVVTHFGGGRHFVNCDGFAASLENFVTRVAKAVGAVVPLTDPLSSLSTFLASLPAPILVILDNAESVLDADNNGSRAQISEAIEEIGAHSPVSLLITTRSRSLPNNLECNRISVEPLSPDAARDAFFAAYKYQPPSLAADPLLTAVGYHALSINLLAVAGAQNEWPIMELHQRWEEEQTYMLDLDDSNRMQSLSASIQISLKSRTLRLFGDKALEVLQVIAFLPQGVDKNKLPELFPSVTNIRHITDAMNRLSLTYLQGSEFITMLAPIRLYIRRITLPTAPLLRDMRDFYFKKLDGMDGTLAKWVAFEDDNLERLLVHFIEVPDALESAIEACYKFLRALSWNKPRTTVLASIIKTVPEFDGTTLWKARSFQALGWVATSLWRYVEAADLLESARQIATAHQHTSVAAECSFEIGQIECTQRNFSSAEKYYKDALKEYQEIKHKDGVAECKEGLGDLAIRRGNLAEAFSYLSDALEHCEREPDGRQAALVRVQLGALALKQGNAAGGEDHFETAIAILTKLGAENDLGWCLFQYAMAEQVIESKNWTKSLDLFERARRHYNQANATPQEARCQLEKGWVFLCQRKLSLARQCFEEAKGECEKAGRAINIADCLRGLGEVAYLKTDDAHGEMLFAEARRLYDLASWVPDRVGVQLWDDLRWDYWDSNG